LKGKNQVEGGDANGRENRGHSRRSRKRWEGQLYPAGSKKNRKKEMGGGRLNRSRTPTFGLKGPQETGEDQIPKGSKKNCGKGPGATETKGW